MALHLWDELISGDAGENNTANFLHETFLPVYRSLALFFVDYMFEGPDGFMHTGPTTSPENSYRYPKKGKTPSDGKVEYLYQQVALSPAFDMSVLRQVSERAS